MNAEESRLVCAAAIGGYFRLFYSPNPDPGPHKHFTVIDQRDVMIQESHVHVPGTHVPTDMIYAENCPRRAAELTAEFSKLVADSQELAPEAICSAVGVAC